MQALTPSLTSAQVAQRAFQNRASLLQEISRMCAQKNDLTPLLDQSNQYGTLVECALDTTFEHHQHQFRHDGELFVNHPIEVARCVVRWGGDANAVIGALLHDVVEDSPVGYEATLAAIGRDFGAEVAWTVWALSKSPAITNKSERSRDAFCKIQSALAFGRINVVAIKLADRLHNTSTAQYLSPDKLEQLENENRSWYAPLAQRVGALQVAGAFAGEASLLFNTDWLSIANESWLKCQCPKSPSTASS